MSCENCNHVQAEMREAPATVPLYAVESQGYRRERTIRGVVILFCVAMLVIALLFGAFGYYAYNLHIQSMDKVESINRYWIDYLGEYDFSGDVYEYSQDGRGLNIMGDNNGVEVSGVIDDGPETENNGETENTEGR